MSVTMTKRTNGRNVGSWKHTRRPGLRSWSKSARESRKSPSRNTWSLHRRPKPPLFASLPDGELLGYGVPSEWLADVRNANEETLLDLADHLPKEAAEALLDLATGDRRSTFVNAVALREFAGAQQLAARCLTQNHLNIQMPSGVSD